MIKRALQVEPVPMRFDNYCDFIRKWGQKALYLEYFDGALQSRSIPEYPKEIDYNEPCITALWEAVNAVLCGVASKFHFTKHEYLRIKIADEEKVLCPHLALADGDSYVFIEVAEPKSTVESDMESAIYRLSQYIKHFPGSRGYAISITENIGGHQLLEVAVGERDRVSTIDVVSIVVGSTVITTNDISCFADFGSTQFYLKWLRSYSTEDDDYATMEAELGKYKIITNTKLQRVTRELKACINQKIAEDETSFGSIPGMFGKALCDVVEGVDKIVATKAYRATGGISRLVENNIMPLMLDKVKPLQKVCQRLAKMQLD